jgi:subtilisin family serine protease
MLAVTVASLPTAAHAQQTIVSGKLLIKLASVPKTDDDARKALAALAADDGVLLELDRRSVLGWFVVNVGALADEETKAVAETLESDKRVRHAQPIAMLHALATPNDPRFPDLWGFAMADIPTAWDTTVGNTSQRIGLVDSGINRSHQDLVEKDLGGFDFVSDPGNALDGDGRDADYTDSDVNGDFHGSHVAGTMIASANDGLGVPGVNWNAGLITARALGTQGGSEVDIGEGALWLAGGHVDGVPDLGQNKVSVINMSLGGPGACDGFEQDVYSSITASGVAVIVATGNDGAFAPVGQPANCPGVISVGAVGPTGELASYSNLDANVTVVAPGGDASDPSDTASAILSVDGATDDGYKNLQGTSMATPHVTGVVSLMQAVNPRLSPSQIKNILLQSPFTCAGSGCDNVSFLDAASAIQLAQQTTGTLTGNEQRPSDPNSASANGCAPNSQLSADGTQCICDPGFVVNATQDGCVASSGGGDTGGGNTGGNTGGGQCPPNSHDAGDGQNCLCDPGFVVNSAQTACVAPPSNDGGGAGNVGSSPDSCRVDRDCDSGSICENGKCVEDRSSHDSGSDGTGPGYGGCSAGGAPTSLVALAALLLLVTFRRASKRGALAMRPSATSRITSLAKLAMLVPVGAVSLAGVGCAHMVRIESTPGADIYVNDQHVGTAPVTYQETTGTSDPVKVTVKAHGKEKTVMVPRNDVDMTALGAGAGAGVGGCLASNVALGVAGFIFPPCWFAFPASCVVLALGPSYGWWYGHKMPDNIQIDMKDASAVAESDNGDSSRRSAGTAAASSGSMARY